MAASCKISILISSVGVNASFKRERAFQGYQSDIEQLKAIVHIQHTRHRSPNNFLVNVLGGILAYIFKQIKPTVSFEKSIVGQQLLTSS